MVVVTPTWWLATIRAWAGALKETGGGAGLEIGCCHRGTQPHLLLARPPTFSLRVPRTAVQLFADVQIQTKKIFWAGVGGCAIILFPFWSIVMDIMYLLALSAQYNSFKYSHICV